MVPVAECVRAAQPASVISAGVAAGLRAPLLIGAIGHRDLRPEDQTLATERFGAFLRRLRRLAPNTPLVLLSGLADGAESLCAEVALSEDVALVACLPFPLERSRHEFEGPALTRFEALLAAALEVRVVLGEGGYLAAGRYVAHYANVLVALWDGAPGGTPDGPAEILHFRGDGSLSASPEAILMGAADTGSAYAIVTGHRANPDPAEAGSERWFDPGVPDISPAHIERSELRVLRLIDRFNDDIGRAPQAPAGAALVERLEAASDARALHFQRYTVNVARALFLLAFVSAMAVTVTEDPFGQTNAAVIKVVGLGIAVAAYVFARRTDIQNRYQDYRALAEGLRVQATWNAFGLPEAAYRNYLRMQLGDLRWIRDVMRTTYFRDSSANVSTTNAWLSEQRDYYAGARQRNLRDRDRFNLVAARATWLGFIVGILLVAGALFRLPYMGVTVVTIGGTALNSTYLLSALVTGAAVLATFVLGYAEFRGYAESARRYERMHRLFTLAATAAKDADAGTRAALVLEVGREALAEHAQWLVLRRQRPLDVRAPA